ncbi:MAG: hypothetical protein ACLS61_15495 [Ruminococcus sp.]
MTRITWLEMTVQIPDWEFTITNMVQIPSKPQVVYDRKYSSVNKLSLEDFPEEMYENTRCFHTSGITLGLGGPVRGKCH